ncbi:hypothetical protein N864_16085 [Intrasporangium chromatireducens Q5-1]|jgi:hypothetical protein|uniref:4-hydroxybenzoate polyprenyltransferase n=1 Tax=Intrasporangium chromatireducens Q5-1 TaxID=584657 RepID=W9GP24_9MICO|nr:hypothetical protein [Intrasporangium chromatireducens]EWT06842.1 hypothetical protein N864_16085 [Intrasporangium chromatireducens Q5-1]
MSDRVLSVAQAAGEAAHELPMPDIAFFFVAFGLFLVALGITWSFRNTAYKLQAPRGSQTDVHHEAIEPPQAHH